MTKFIWITLLLISNFTSDGQTAKHYDIIIDELFPDPSPQVGLPASEFVELKNVSAINFNLAGWTISDGSSTALLTDFILQPDSFVIICAKSSAISFAAFGPTLGVTGLPSLNNDADVVFISSPENNIIHAVNYSSGWYQNELKKEGGWTMEMIDTKDPCSGFSNWKASTDLKGGTPGRRNSVESINLDQQAPELQKIFSPDSIDITLVFDEPLDSFTAATTSNYLASDGLGTPVSAVTDGPLFNIVRLQLNAPMVKNKVYTLTVSHVTDCSGNIISGSGSMRFGLAESADSFDLVINEILFNPPAGGVDYVEIYNRSKKIIDLKQLYIANRNATGVISNIIQLNGESRQLFPGDFIVATTDMETVKKQYFTKDPLAFVQLAPLPSFPNDKGDVILLNSQGNIMDEVRYFDQWHFKLIVNTEGVSLERIDFNAPSTSNNFHSAATSVGYGTPGYKNSQYRNDQEITGEVITSPEIFSPDNDGMDDVLTIDYHFPSVGYVANITIFDASGRPVRYLQRNALSGIKGNYRWDGLGEKQQKLQQGIYIIFTEIFNAEGKKKQFKNTVVLARK